MRSSKKSLKLLCTTRPFSNVMSWPNAAPMPSSTAPCTWFSAPVGLMIGLPTSLATQTLSIMILPPAPTVACTTSAKYPR